MKKQIQLLTLGIVLLFSAGVVFAQKTTRLKFARGATVLTASGRLNGYKDSRVFLVRLRKGQTLETEQIKNQNSSHYITVALKAPSGEDAGDSDASCNNRKTVAPTQAGDYRITVFECQKADPWRGAFRLKIKVK